MKLARVDSEGLILELFDSQNIENKFHRDFIAELTEVSDDVEKNDYFVEGEKIQRKPSRDFELVNKQWVKKQDAITRELREQKIAEFKALELANDASAIEIRAVVRKILELLKEKF